jgi:hypothetical protein
MKFQLLCADYLFVDCPNRHDARRYAIKLGYAFKLWHIRYHGLIFMSSSFMGIIRLLHWFGKIILKLCSCIYFKNKELVLPPKGIVKIQCQNTGHVIRAGRAGYEGLGGLESREVGPVL